ncbi:hypothetical protein SUGI_0063250 [Cryptomeria japonica]|nr:hypothetical protein SUGI_0063250 [Cryptomeria japonica]
MSREEDEGELSSRMTNAQIVKFLRDQNLVHKLESLQKEVDRLNGELHKKSDVNSNIVEEGSDVEPLVQEEEEVPINQRLLVKTLKAMERRTMDVRFYLYKVPFSPVGTSLLG